MKTPKPDSRYNFVNLSDKDIETLTRTATVSMTNHALNIIWALYDQVVTLRYRIETLEELNDALRESLECKNSQGQNI